MCSVYYCLKACFVFLLSGPVALSYAAASQLPQWYKAPICTLFLHHSYSGYCTGAWNQTIRVQVSSPFLTYCVPEIQMWKFIKRCIWKMLLEKTHSEAHNILKKHSPTLFLPRISNTTKISSTESSGKVPCSSRNFWDYSCNMCWVITLDQEAVGHRTRIKKRKSKSQEMHRMNTGKTRLLAVRHASVSET